MWQAGQTCLFINSVAKITEWVEPCLLVEVYRVGSLCKRLRSLAWASVLPVNHGESLIELHAVFRDNIYLLTCILFWSESFPHVMCPNCNLKKCPLCLSKTSKEIFAFWYLCRREDFKKECRLCAIVCIIKTVYLILSLFFVNWI